MLNMSSKNTNNCGNLKYILRTKPKNLNCLKLPNIQTQKSKKDANLNFQEGGGGGGMGGTETETERDRGRQRQRERITQSF